MNNFRDILKIILIVGLFIVFSPVIFGVFGFVLRSLFFIIILAAVAISGVVVYLKYKAKKLEKEYKEDPNLKYYYDTKQNDHEENKDDSFIDYSDSTIIDVDYEESDDRGQNN